jgi:phosphatidylglycerol lysyltransferase
VSEQSQPDPDAGSDVPAPGGLRRLLARAWEAGDAAFERVLHWWRNPVVTAVVSLAVFLIALRLIAHEMSAYTLADLELAFRDLGVLPVLLAIAAALVSYTALTFNDRFALAMIGKRLPLARSARASFAAYALAKTLGWSWATAGTARQRLYRRWGLAPTEIGALSFVTGTGVMVAALTVAGIGLLLGGVEVARHGPLPAAVWWLFGLSCLLPAGLWLAWTGRAGEKSVKFGDTPLRLPPLRRSTAHLSAMLLDRVGAAMVLYALLPDHGGWSFPAFLAVFVLAGLLGALSGAPGGLGVFEAVILTLTPVSQDTPGAAVALVTFRLIYNVVPLAIATTILGLDHAAPAARPAARAAQRIGEAAFEFSPRILAIMVFAGGLLLLGSVATPGITARIVLLDRLELRALSELSHFMASLAGVMLLVVAAGLWRKVDQAWGLAVLLLIAGIVFCLAKALDVEEAIALGIVLAILVPCRPAFNRRGGLLTAAPTGATSGTPLGAAISPGWLAAVLGSVAAAAWLGLFAHQNIDYSQELWWAFLADNDAARSLRALTGAAILTLFVLLWVLTGPARARAASKSRPEDMVRAMQAFAGADSPRADTNLAFLGDKSFVFSPSGASFVMYRPRGDRWIIYGEPVGLAAEREALVEQVRREAEAQDVAPVYYAVSRDAVPELAAQGLAVRKIGETAVIDLAVFNLVGKDRQPLRTARNRFAKLGATFSVVPAEGTPACLDQMEAVSDAWLSSRKGREKTFTLGAFDRAYLSRFPTALAHGPDGKLMAFANLWTTPNRHEVSIDLMRQGSGAPHGVMDWLITETALWAQSQGFARFDLGMAPLSGLNDRKGAPLLARLGAIVFEEAEELYGFRGLAAFKDKFGPQWEPLFLCAPPDVLMPAALLDVAMLTSGGMRGLFARSR